MQARGLEVHCDSTQMEAVPFYKIMKLNRVRRRELGQGGITDKLQARSGGARCCQNNVAGRGQCAV